jgi:ribosome-binding factor A
MPKRTRTHHTARDYPRTARLNRLFQEILAEELERGDDDRLEMVTITAVTVEADLHRAVVLYDNPGGADDDEDVIAAFGEIRARLQSAIARQARVKRTPELVFRPDDVLRGAARLEEVLRDLREEP